MEIDKLDLKWAEFRCDMKLFEQQKEKELREKHPNLTDSDIEEKLEVAVNRTFKNRAWDLLREHMILTNQKAC